MKKGKTILAAAALGALIYTAWQAFDRQDLKPAESVAVTPEETPVPQVAVATPVPARRMAARKAVRSNQTTAETQAEPTATTRTQDIPMPSGWNGQFTKQDLHAETRDCDLDRPCSPRGRDGVLLMGVSIALRGLRPEMPQSLSVGSYERRTPLLVYK